MSLLDIFAAFYCLALRFANKNELLLHYCCSALCEDGTTCAKVAGGGENIVNNSQSRMLSR